MNEYEWILMQEGGWWLCPAGQDKTKPVNCGPAMVFPVHRIKPGKNQEKKWMWSYFPTNEKGIVESFNDGINAVEQRMSANAEPVIDE